MNLKQALEAAIDHVPPGTERASSKVLAGLLVNRAQAGEKMARRVILAAARAIRERPIVKRPRQWSPE